MRQVLKGKRKMSKGKKVWIGILSVFLALCLAVDVWWLRIALFAKEKSVSWTFNPSELVKVDGSKEDIWTLRYYANADKSGLEMFEVDFKSFMDENREDIKSQGLQFVADDVDSSLEWTVNWPENYLSRSYLGKNNWYWRVTKAFFKKRYYASFGQWGLKTGSTYNYASSNNYETTINDNEGLGANSAFKISITDENQNVDIYKMKFKGDYFNLLPSDLNSSVSGATNVLPYSSSKNVYPSESELRSLNGNNYMGRYKDGLNGFYTDYIDTFASFDPYWFAYELYNSVAKKVTEYGTENYFTFAWGDYFDYQIYNQEKGYYEDAVGEQYTKVYNYVTSNITIKLEVYERGAKVASDSLFNVIHDDASFNLTGETSYEDYFYGQNVVNLNVSDFDLVQVVAPNYCLKMNDSAYNFYSQYKNQISLSICIDLDVLNEKGYIFAGFTTDSRLSEFEIYDCYTLETIDGEIVRTEVEYGTIT